MRKKKNDPIIFPSCRQSVYDPFDNIRSRVVWLETDVETDCLSGKSPN